MLDTENGGPSSASTSSSTPENVKLEADNLAKDLVRLVSEVLDDKRITTDNARRTLLIQSLCIYIVERDTRVMIHGYNVGKQAEQL